MSTVLIINPYCRNGEVDATDVEKVLLELGDVEIVKLTEHQSIEEKIASLGQHVDRVVVAGGDGTLNSVLPGILNTNLPLGIIPCGTANDFARSLGVPDDPVAAAQMIVQNYTRPVDVGVVNDHYYLNAAGIGLGPQLTKHLDHEKKKRLGVLAYMESLIKVFGERRRRFATLTVDGNVERIPFIQITVASGKHYGGGMTISDEVQMDDGLLHVLCVLPLTPFQLLLRGLRIKYGAVQDDEKLVYRTGRKVIIQTHKTCDVTADGELVAHTPIECTVLNRALDVFVPRESMMTTDASAAALVGSLGEQVVNFAAMSTLK